MPAGQQAGWRASPPALPPPGTGLRPPASKVYPVPPVPTAARCRITRRGRNAPGQPLYRHTVALDTGDPLAPLRRDPATAGIFSDFGGTLSPIVDDPELAEPVAGGPQTPRKTGPALRRRCCRLGSPGRFPRRPPAASALLAGLYGLEVQRHGERQTDPEAERRRAAVSAAVIRLHAVAPPGVPVEPKSRARRPQVRGTASPDPPGQGHGHQEAGRARSLRPRFR
jgi:hypothetical protein